MNAHLITGLISGAAVGALGIKYYHEHKRDIDTRVRSFFPHSSSDAVTAENARVSLEELEAQKERLEDLIAELKASQNSSNDDKEN